MRCVCITFHDGLFMLQSDQVYVSFSSNNIQLIIISCLGNPLLIFMGKLFALGILLHPMIIIVHTIYSATGSQENCHLSSMESVPWLLHGLLLTFAPCGRTGSMCLPCFPVDMERYRILISAMDLSYPSIWKIVSSTPDSHLQCQQNYPWWLSKSSITVLNYHWWQSK